MTKDHREQWGTQLGVILAVSGSAVGLGNFLRFPGQAAQNGGGAFLIPYFAALLLLGIPIGWAEWATGRYGGKKGLHSAPAILGLIGRGRWARYLGVIGVLIPVGVSFYYVFIEAWTFGYFLKYLTGGIGVDPTAPIAAQKAAAASFFNAFTGASADGSLFGRDGWLTLASWAFVFGVNIWFVSRGISKGIEKFCSWAMPAMAVCALIVLARVLTLGTPDPAAPEQNVLAGLGYMWNPNYSKLADFGTWLAAAGQVFFTLSVGFGVIINYASYMKPKDDVALSGLTSSATNELFEVGFGGMITLTAAYVFLGLSGTADAVANGSFSLGFATLPIVFAQMGPLGNFIGAVWFFMLFLAAITSSLSMYQPAVALLKESLGVSHGQATAGVAALGTLGSLLTLWFTADGAFWSTLDFWIGTLLLFVMAGIQIVAFAWVFGIERGWQEIHSGAAIRIPGVFRFIMKYVAPTYLVVVFVGFCVQGLGPALRAAWATAGARAGMLTILATLALLLLVVWAGEKRLRGLGMDIDDKEGARPRRSST